jgi:putative sugar O-methyltransferase
MKLGPFHLLKDRTYRRLQQTIDGLTAQLIHRYASMHPMLNVRVAPPVILDPDPSSERVSQAVARVVAAFQRAQADRVRDEPSYWDLIEDWNRPFLTALGEGDEPAVQAALARMFQSSLIWGLGRVHESFPQQMRAQPTDNYFQRMVTDTLVSMAEAVAATRLTLADQQGVRAHLDALNVDLDGLFRKVETRTGLDLSFPAVGATYGVQIDSRLVTIDTLMHGYAVYRLRQLGASADSVIAEIGGGYGCLGCLMGRAGHGPYLIYDLPWVNALQGYFLILALPAGSVRLYGESDGDLQVLPYWCFHELPDQSVDFIVNTNSLPEMAAATARRYLATMKRVLRGKFFSVNQEAGVEAPVIGPQHCLAQLMEEVGGFQLLHRSRYWMWQGYLEEVYARASTETLDHSDHSRD